MGDGDQKTRLRVLREEAGYASAAEFARKHKFTVVTYRSAENSSRNLTIQAAKQYADALTQDLGRPVSWLYLIGEEILSAPSSEPESLPPQVPVVGKLGAAGQFLPFDEYPKGGGLRYVDPPPGAKPDTIALEIEGDSQHPLQPGWLVFYRRQQEGVPPACLNKMCVVKVSDGSTLLKIVRRGSSGKLFTLESWNAPSRQNVALEWASPVLDIRPT